MTAGLAKEVATEGIRVNAVRPGLIESDFHLHATPGPRRAHGARSSRCGAPAPPPRWPRRSLWLASAAASYVTGAFVDVTGGR